MRERLVLRALLSNWEPADSPPTAVIPAFIAGTHSATNASASGTMGPGTKSRDDK